VQGEGAEEEAGCGCVVWEGGELLKRFLGQYSMGLVFVCWFGFICSGDVYGWEVWLFVYG